MKKNDEYKEYVLKKVKEGRGKEKIIKEISSDNIGSDSKNKVKIGEPTARKIVETILYEDFIERGGSEK